MADRTFIIDNVSFKGGIQMHLPTPELVIEHADFNVSQIGSAWLVDSQTSAGNFGYSISACQNTILVGCPFETVNGLTNAGAVYFYTLTNGIWGLTDRFTATTPHAGDCFGWSVALFFNRAVVGAPFANNNQGTVYAYIKVNTSQHWWATWNAGSGFPPYDSLTETSGKFGYSLICQGLTVIIGAPDAFGGSSDGTRRGAAYHYYFSVYGTELNYSDKIIPTQYKDGGKFGFALALQEENSLAISAPFEDVAFNGTKVNSGTVYIFTKSSKSTWFRQSRLISPNPQNNANFGYSMDITMGRLVVGEPNNGLGGNIYVWEGYGATWTYTASLTARVSGGTIGDNTVLESDNQGFTVKQDALTKTILTSSPNNNSGKGCIYVYEEVNGSWVPGFNNKIVSGDVSNGDNFGYSFNFLIDTIVAGSPNKSSGYGAFYMLSTNPVSITEPSSSFTLETHTYVTVPIGSVPNSSFGSSISIRNTRTVIGAPGATVSGTANAGIVYIFYLLTNNLYPEMSISSPDPAETRNFGKTAIFTDNGEFLVVGCDNVAGSERVYLYTFDTDLQAWNFRAKIDKPSLFQEFNATMFGYSLAFVGSTLMVGAPISRGNNTVDTTARGGVFHYDVNHATKVATYVIRITPADYQVANNSYFGASVSLYGENKVAIGAPHSTVNGTTNAGAVYIYNRNANQWDLETKIVSSSIEYNAGFGTSVSLGSNRLAVGKPYINRNVIGNVSVYDFNNGAWHITANLVAISLGGTIDDSLVTGFDLQGSYVILHNDTIVVGSPLYNSSQGCVYIYKYYLGQWIAAPTSKRIPQDATSGTNFYGLFFDFNGTNLIVGSPGRNSLTGGVYVYHDV